MIAATYTQGQGFAVKDVERPKAGRGEAIIHVAASSICGTDMRIIRNGHRKLHDLQQVVLGHEFVGVIEDVGPEAQAPPAGTRVGVAPNFGCGKCDMCIRGLANMCPDYEAFGICFDGAHAEYVRIPEAVLRQGNVNVLPASLSWTEGSLIEPLSCVVNGLENCRVELGDTVLIFGAGPIGLMHVMLANVMGAARVIVVDMSEARLARAREVGAGETLNGKQGGVNEAILEITDGKGVNVAVTACSVASVQEQALHLLAPYGRLSLFGGLPQDSATVNFNSNLIHYKNLFVTGCTGGALIHYRKALAMVAARRVDVRQVVSHVIDPRKMGDAFDVALSGDCLKVVIQNGRHD